MVSARSRSKERTRRQAIAVAKADHSEGAPWARIAGRIVEALTIGTGRRADIDVEEEVSRLLEFLSSSFPIGSFALTAFKQKLAVAWGRLFKARIPYRTAGGAGGYSR
jgi:hypothetical protein